MLADLCGHNAPDPFARGLCPPSYKIKEGKLLEPDKSVDPLWNGKCPSTWFLKENSRNYGQGIDVCQTADEALEIAAAHEADEPGAGRDFVLQPHVIDPLLYLDKHKFHIRV